MGVFYSISYPANPANPASRRGSDYVGDNEAEIFGITTLVFG